VPLVQKGSLRIKGGLHMMVVFRTIFLWHLALTSVHRRRTDAPRRRKRLQMGLPRGLQLQLPAAQGRGVIRPPPFLLLVLVRTRAELQVTAQLRVGVEVGVLTPPLATQGRLTRACRHLEVLARLPSGVGLAWA